MKDSSLVVLGSIFVTLLGLNIHAAWASQTALTAGAAANMSATCDFGGATAQAIAVTGTAANATVTSQGNVRIVCTTASHFLQGAAGVTGVTAITGSSYIPADTVEYIRANTSIFSFIRETSSGTCYLTECK